MTSGSRERPRLGSVPDVHERLRHPSVAELDPRVVDVWCTWLGQLATNAEAALAAAIAYRDLDAASRTTWLDALEHDAPRLSVPPIAIYAPLLAVESDPDRRARILQAIGPSPAAAAQSRVEARFGLGSGGLRVAVVASPLYLDFVQVLACGYRRANGFEWVRHDPIVDRRQTPRPGDRLAEVVLESVPVEQVVDDLALAVLAHVRAGRVLPEALRIFVDLFGVDRAQVCAVP